MIKALKEGFLHYVDFSGRSTRAMFWNFVVGTHLLILLCMLPAMLEFFRFYDFLLHDTRFIDTVFGGGMIASDAVMAVVQELGQEYSAVHGPFYSELAGMVLGTVLALAVLIPTVAITVRRLRMPVIVSCGCCRPYSRCCLFRMSARWLCCSVW